MYLRRLDVHGFKAFASRQRFEFGPGLTVIAGPNGSGKSNVADAIRWALGEQSQKQIRARRTEDVIFSGSEQRRQLGMAEVTLTLDNSERWMPLDFAEVSVTRRAHRSGDNEYLINKQQVRLADVVDLFRRAQVGQNSYAHMTQGLVDEVLALRPGDRRELIEEAADLRRHRHQLTLSERRLVETRDNLGHARMLIREVEPRIKQLQRQSRRATRYQALASELTEALTVYFETEVRAAREAHTSARAAHDQSTQAVSAARSEVQRVDARLSEVQGHLARRRDELEQLQARERALAEEGLRLEQAVALAQQRLDLITERRTELERTIASTTLPEEDDGAIDGVIAEAETGVAEAQAQLARDREALASADEATRSVLRDLAEAETRRARLEASLDEAQRRVRDEERRREQREQERVEAQQRQRVLQQAAAEQRQHLEAHQREAEGFATAAGEAREARAAAERRLEEQQAALTAAEQAMRDAEAHVAQLEERQRLIELLRDSAPSGDSGADALLAAAMHEDGEGLAGIVDAVSRLIRVPDGLETAISAALAEHLSAVVVDDYPAALRAIAYLREQEAGTATVYPLDSAYVGDGTPSSSTLSEPGVTGIAARLVECAPRYRPLVDALLGRVLVVEDLAAAERLAGRSDAIVTRDGVLLHRGGAIYGGVRGAAEEQFALQRELDDLPAQIAEATAAVAPLRSQLDTATAAVAGAREQMAAARRAVDEAEERRRQHDAQRAALERQEAEIASELRSLEQRLREDPAETQGAEELQQRVEATRAEVAAVGERIEALRDRSEAVGAERDAVAARVEQGSQGVARLEADHRALVAQRDERVAARRAALEEHRRRQEQLEALCREQEDLEFTLRDRREHHINNRTARSEVQSAIGPLHATVAELAQEESELATSRGDAQRQLAAAEREQLEQENRLRQQAERVERLMQDVAAEGMEFLDDGSVRQLPRAVSDDDAEDDDGEDDDGEDGGGTQMVVVLPVAERAARPAPAPLRGGAEVDVDELRTRIAELRGQIKSLGPVNLDALDELGVEQERYEFLVEQVADLEAAEQELRQAIRELKKLIRTRFVETFDVVNDRFGAYFVRFFGGGQAELRLIEPEEGDEDAEPGVEIVAQPPGKRISNLQVLSGGERSMTSVALLFALLSVNPAPVVVLDEVDAALDEANVGRFVDTLVELKGRSQFVVISHNRRTIEAADAIYGVSMAGDSTSQVLSLKLADLPEAG